MQRWSQSFVVSDINQTPIQTLLTRTRNKESNCYRYPKRLVYLRKRLDHTSTVPAARRLATPTTSQFPPTLDVSAVAWTGWSRAFSPPKKPRF